MADDLVSILPYLFVKSKIKRLFTHFLFTLAFHISDDSGGQIEVYLTNFRIIIERIQSYKFTDSDGRTNSMASTVDSMYTPRDTMKVDFDTNFTSEELSQSRTTTLIEPEP